MTPCHFIQADHLGVAFTHDEQRWRLHPVQHADGKVWRFTGTVCSGSSCPGWQMLDNNPNTTGIEAAGSALFQLHGN